MKRTAAIMALVAITAVSAMAYPGAGRGQSPCGNGFGGGPGMGGGFGGAGQQPCFNQAQGEPLDDAGAKGKVQEYIDANLKGFKIVDGAKVEMPRGAMYTFEVKDANGNLFLFRVSPFGQLRGPVPAKDVK